MAASVQDDEWAAEGFVEHAVPKDESDGSVASDLADYCAEWAAAVVGRCVDCEDGCECCLRPTSPRSPCFFFLGVHGR